MQSVCGYLMINRSSLLKACEILWKHFFLFLYISFLISFSQMHCYHKVVISQVIMLILLAEKFWTIKIVQEKGQAVFGTRSVQQWKYFASLCITTHFEIIIVYLLSFFSVIPLNFWLRLKHKLQWRAKKEKSGAINIYNAFQNRVKFYSEYSFKIQK